MNHLSHTEPFSLKKIGIFAHLSHTQRTQIENIGIIRSYSEGEVIFYEGDESSYFHFLIDGEVSVYKSSASLDTITIHHFHAPSLIAEVATLKQIPYPASCEAKQISVLLKIPRDPFLHLLQNDPSLSIALISSLTQKISALELALQRHTAPNAIAKVARLIRDDLFAFNRLKQIEIARLIGITPETLSRILKKLKIEGVIAHTKSEGITVLSDEILISYCG
ncbi:Crp/Fnr family transcriptional regulator [Sulfuricurvum sp.]|uniref:Crp/Fnr family transcriptional regulator n=1 Tax=Sulfuricurvum sp. TaxID=2025608 RepID=UPI0026086614|nr:Crp/Fnr family transcriptional regulator [Sulfuricurvum sp.]MDD2266620.1 Crp/Fnr family transcriptional regulator [Sulfuricurvum sp.]MDD2784437.1 Crp/Fnr family transcriptional regulator [Sulfuricurvum sp.]